MSTIGLCSLKSVVLPSSVESSVLAGGTETEMTGVCTCSGVDCAASKLSCEVIGDPASTIACNSLASGKGLPRLLTE